MREFIVLVKRELKSIKKEKTIMFAIFIQLFVASFSSVMVMGVMSFYDPTTIGENPQRDITIAVTGDTRSPIVDYVGASNAVKVIPAATFAQAEEAFQAGHVDAIMNIPSVESGVVDMDLYLPQSDVASTVILMTISEPLKDAENHLRQQNGIELKYTDLEGKPHTSYEFLYSVLIPLLMLFPALIAGSIVIDTVSEELENKTIDTLWSAPVSLNEIFSSKVFAALLTALAQCGLWILLLGLNAYTVRNPGLVLGMALLVAATISLGAGIIAIAFKDRERAQFVYSITLLLSAGLSYILDPSPFGLITRLAAGSHHVGPAQVSLYVVPPIIVGAVFYFIVSRRIVAGRN